MRMLIAWRPLPLVLYMLGSLAFLAGSAISLWREVRQ